MDPKDLIRRTIQLQWTETPEKNLKLSGTLTMDNKGQLLLMETDLLLTSEAIGLATCDLITIFERAMIERLWEHESQQIP